MLPLFLGSLPMFFNMSQKTSRYNVKTAQNDVLISNNTVLEVRYSIKT